MADRTQEAVATSTATASAVSIGTTAAVVAANRDSRVSVLAVNNGSVTVYLGGAGVTASTGFPVASNSSFEERDYTGALYGVTASGTADVRVWEVG